MQLTNWEVDTLIIKTFGWVYFDLFPSFAQKWSLNRYKRLDLNCSVHSSTFVFLSSTFAFAAFFLMLYIALYGLVKQGNIIINRASNSKLKHSNTSTKYFHLYLKKKTIFYIYCKWGINYNCNNSVHRFAIIEINKCEKGFLE